MKKEVKIGIGLVFLAFYVFLHFLLDRKSTRLNSSHH